MAQNRYKDNDVIRVLSDKESEMKVDNKEEGDFYKSGTETSDAESLHISDYPSDSYDDDSDNDSSGWRQGLPSYND